MGITESFFQGISNNAETQPRNPYNDAEDERKLVDKLLAYAGVLFVTSMVLLGIEGQAGAAANAAGSEGGPVGPTPGETGGMDTSFQTEGQPGYELMRSGFVFYPDGDNVNWACTQGGGTCLHRETVPDDFCADNIVNRQTAENYPDDAACQWQELWQE